MYVVFTLHFLFIYFQQGCHRTCLTCYVFIYFSVRISSCVSNQLTEVIKDFNIPAYHWYKKRLFSIPFLHSVCFDVASQHGYNSSVAFTFLAWFYCVLCREALRFPSRAGVLSREPGLEAPGGFQREMSFRYQMYIQV